ncbi:MAG: hypothetical protein PF484_07685 [Bacteroidales bacterium]|jgi:hypothetical protein|nr:hypothetical protein [Bacteroidales bacterium]
MKTLKITLFFIIGIFFTLNSFAQDVKKEKTAKIRMEVIDEDGNKKVIDSTFKIDDTKDYKAVLKQIKENVGFNEEEIALMKNELKSHAKELAIDVEVMMDDIDKDKLHEHLMIAREKMNCGKEDVQKAMEELKAELASMKMNEVAMEKLEKAMEKLKAVKWDEHAKKLKVEMKNLHEHFDNDKNVFFIDSDHGKKHVWIDDDGENHIVIDLDIDIDGDSLELSKMHNLMYVGDHDADNQNVWVEKDGEKIIIKKVEGGENTIFFGDEADLEKIHELDGDHNILVKKLKGEAAKGDAIFISDDADVIKEFKDEDGNVKVMRYKMKSGAGEAKEMKVMRNPHAMHKKEIKEIMMMISPAGDKGISLANTKGILDTNATILELNEFNFNIDNETTSLGATFQKKGKLVVQIFDKEMNQLWKEKAGKVIGEWSTEIPSDVLKDTGIYYFLFEQGKKAKLMKMVIK